MNNQSRQELALLYFHNHNETVVSKAESPQSESTKTVELSVEDLTAIAGGGLSGGVDTGCPFELCGGNHNETVVSAPLTTASDQPNLVQLSEEDLTLICGGRSKEDGEPAGSD